MFSFQGHCEKFMYQTRKFGKASPGTKVCTSDCSNVKPEFAVMWNYQIIITNQVLEFSCDNCSEIDKIVLKLIKLDFLTQIHLTSEVRR